jgi:TatD DNase family protein
MVTICTQLKDEPKVRKIAEKFDCVLYAAGTHPMNAHKEPMINVSDLLEIAKHPKFVGIGETGLDYYYTKETEKDQKKSLLLHIEAAQKSRLPLIIHARAADKDIANILESEYKNAKFSCVMHCFSSGRELAIKMLDLGFYLSMSGIITFPKSDELRDIFSLTPIDRILVETDSPYLAPPPYRGKRNEPAYVALTAKKGAEIFDIPYNDFAHQIEENFERLFPKAKIHGAAT